jgi:DNA-binding NarL/FixJ family response regulator
MQPLSVYDGGPLRAAIAEGQGLVRAGLRILLEHQDDMVVVADAATVDEVVEAARSKVPDVVLVDLDLPGAGGIEAARRLLEEVPDGATRVVMLMTSQADDAVFGALRAGATGLLLKDAGPDELLAAVRVVARGEALLAPGVASGAPAQHAGGARRAHGARARGRGARGVRPEQRGDRRAAGGHTRDGQDAREPRALQAPRARPRAARRPRVRGRPRPSRAAGAGRR